jgi:hypothetical protein
VDSDDVAELDVFVQLAVAGSPFADPDDLEALARVPESDAHDRLAEFGSLPPDAVRALALHPEPRIRAMLVRNRRLGPAVADLRTALLVDDPSTWVRSELLELDLPVALRRRVLAGLPEREVLHPQPWMPADLLERIVAGADDDELLLETAVRCLPADSGVLRSLCTAADPSWRGAAAANPVLPDALRERLARDEDAGVRQAAVEASLGTTTLLRLAEDPEHLVRWSAVGVCRSVVGAASRPGADLAALDRALTRAAHDSAEDVRAQAAQHPPLHGLLLDDPSWYVRSAVAGTSADPDVLRRLTGDVDLDVVDAVADNPQAPPGLLCDLTDQATAAWARTSGLGPGQQPREGYGGFVAMNDARRLARLVANPALPDDVAARLLDHRSPTVGDAALLRLGHDPDAVPARALALRHRRGLLWHLLARADVPVHGPAAARAVLARLPATTGSVADLARTLRRGR